jgi:adenosylcobinamide kinase / adenosylcobinamide-phosphate guanylyltransferase
LTAPGPLVLVLGGARSGKSRHAEARFDGLAAMTYVATAQAFDEEMRERIAEHRGRRDARWTTIDAPLDLAEALAAIDGPVLVDCLTLWLSNTMLAGRDVAAAGAELLAALSARRGLAVCVSNEVGLGIVPDTPLGRRFRDAQGRLNQSVAAIADEVVFVAAGLPLVLKAGGR